MRAAGWAMWSASMTNIVLIVVLLAGLALVLAFAWLLFNRVIAPIVNTNAQLTGQAQERLEPPDVVFRAPLSGLARRRPADLVKSGRDWRDR